MTAALPYIALCLTALFWGMSFVATKVALVGFSPAAVLFLRFLMASVVFGALLACSGPLGLTRRLHKRLALLSLFMPGAYFVFETYGIKYTTSTKAALLCATIPVLVSVASSFLEREKMSARAVVGGVLSFIGVCILVLAGDAGGLGGVALGDVLMIGAVLAATVYMIMAADLGRSVSYLVVTGFQMFYGAAMFLPFFLVDAARGGLASATFESFASVVALALFATVGAFLFYNYALAKVAAARASLFINAVPVVTAVTAWLYLGERLSPLQFAGAVMVLMAVYLASSGKKEDIVEEIEEGCAVQPEG